MGALRKTNKALSSDDFGKGRADKGHSVHFRRLSSVVLMLFGWSAIQPYGDVGFRVGMAVGHAGVIADPNAAIVFRPTLGESALGVPRIDITAPNAGGLSLNQYQRFDVDGLGLILNNSLTGGSSLLGGQVGGNPNLMAGRPARIIVNEVTVAGAPGRLSGTIEVFGAPAEVIIANPNGLVCAGCGVVNTPRLGLVTGSPVYFDRQGAQSGFDQAEGLGYDVRGGRIVIEGAGLEGTVGRLDLIGASLLLDAPLRAHYLNQALSSIQLAAGTGLVRETTEGGHATEPADATAPDAGAMPALAIDASLVGAMTAGQIKIVATDHGPGVRLGGPLVAYQRGIDLRANGDVDLGRLAAVGDIHLDSAGNLTLRQDIDAGGRLTGRSAGHLEAHGGLAAVGDLQLRAGGDLETRGDLATRGVLDLQAVGGLKLGGPGSRADAAGDARLAGGDIVQQGTLNVGATLSATAARSLVMAGELAAGRDLRLEAGTHLELGGRTVAGDDLVLTAARLDLGGDLLAGRDLVARAGIGLNLTGTATAGNRLELGGRTLRVEGGIQAPLIAIEGHALDLGVEGRSHIIEGDFRLALDGALNVWSALEVRGNAQLSCADDGHFADGMRIGGELDLRTGGHLTLAGDLHVTGQATLIAGGTLSALGTMDAGGLTLSATGAHLAGALTSAGDLMARAGSGGLHLDAALTAGGALDLQTTGDLRLDGDASASDLRLIADGRLRAGGILRASGGGLLAAGADLSFEHTLVARDDIVLHTTGDLDVRADLQAGAALRARSGGDMRYGGDLQAGDQLALEAGGDLRIDGATRASTGMRLIAGHDLSTGALEAGALEARATRIEIGGPARIGGDARLDADRLILADALLTGGGLDLLVGAGGLRADGILKSNRDLRIAALGDLHLGDVLALDDLHLESRAGVIEAGDLLAGRDLVLDALGDLQAGTLQAGRDLVSLSRAGRQQLAGAQAGRDLRSQAGLDLGIAGDLAANGDLGLIAGGFLELRGQVRAGGDLTAEAWRIELRDGLHAGGHATLHAQGGDLRLGDEARVGGDARLTGARLELAGARIGGRLTLTAAGALDAQGDLIADGDIDAAAAGDLRVVGDVASAGNLHLRTQTDLTLNGDAQAQGRLELAALGGLSAGELRAGGDLRTDSGGDTRLRAVLALGELIADAGGEYDVNGNLIAETLAIVARGDIAIAGYLAAAGGIQLASEADIRARSLLGGTEPGALASLSAQGNLTLDDDLRYAGDYQAHTGGHHHIGGDQLIGGDASLQIGGDARVGGDLWTGGDHRVQTGGVLATQGDSHIQGEAWLHAGGAQNHGGDLLILGSLDALAGDGVSVGGDLRANGPLTLAGGGRVEIGGALASQADVDLRGHDGLRIGGDVRFQRGSLASAQGGIELGGDVEIAGDLLLTAGGDLDLLGDLIVTGDLGAESAQGSIVFRQRIAANGAFTARAAADLEFHGDSRLLGATRLEAGGRLLNLGDLQLAQGLDLELAGDLVNEGRLQAEGDLKLKARHITSNLVTAGGLYATGRLDAHADGQITLGQQGVFGAASGMALTSTGLVNHGRIQTGGLLLHQGGGYDNHGLTAAETIDLRAGLVNTGLLHGDSLDIAGHTLNTGRIAGLGLRLASLDNDGDLDGASLHLGSTHNRGHITGDAIDIAGGLVNTGTLGAAGQLVVHGGGIDNTGDLLGGDIALQGSQLANGGRIQAAGDLAIQVGHLANTLWEGDTCVADPHVCAQTAYPDGSPPRPLDPTTDYRWTQQIGRIHAGGRLDLDADSLDNQGVLESQGDLRIRVAGTLDNRRSVNDLYTHANHGAATPTTNTGLIQAGGDLDLQAGGLVNHGGKLQAGGRLDLDLSGALANLGPQADLLGELIGARIELRADALQNQGRLRAGVGGLNALIGGGGITSGGPGARMESQGDLILQTSGGLINGALGTLRTDERLSIRATHLVNAGTLYGVTGPARIIDIVLDGLFHNHAGGIVLADQTLNLEVGDYANQGVVGSFGDARLQAPILHRPGDGEVIARGHLDLAVTGIDVDVGQTWVADSALVTWSGTLVNRGEVDLKGDAIGHIANLSGGTPIWHTGAPAGDGGYHPGPAPDDLTNAIVIGHHDLGTRAWLRIGGQYSGHLYNLAGDALIGGGAYIYTADGIDQAITWSGQDGDGQTATRAGTGQSLPRLLTGPGLTVLTLTTPTPGTVIGDVLVIQGGDLNLGGGIDIDAARQAIADARDHRLPSLEGAEAGAAEALEEQRRSIGRPIGPTVAVGVAAPGAPSVVPAETLIGALVGPASGPAGPAPGAPAGGGGDLPGAAGVLSQLHAGGHLELPGPDLTEPRAGVAALLAGDRRPSVLDWSDQRIVPGGVSANELELLLGGRLVNRSDLDIAGDLWIDAAGGIDNSGAAIQAGGHLMLRGGGLDNLGGHIEAGSLWADLDGDLDNSRGRIRVTDWADLAATGDLTAREGEFHAAGGDLVLSAGGDLRLIASRVTAESGRIGLIAGGDLELDGRWQTRSDTRQEEESWRIDAPIEAGGDIWSPLPEARQLAGGGTRTQEARQERAWQGTEIQGQSVLIHAGGDLTATGGRIEGRDGVTLTAGRDLSLRAAVGRNWTETTETGSHGDVRCLLGDDCGGSVMHREHQERHEQERVHGVELTSGGDLTLAAGRDLALESARLESGGHGWLEAGGDLRLEGRHARARSRIETRWSGHDGLSGMELEGSASTDRSEALWHGSGVSTGGDLILRAQGDVRLHGAELTSGGALAVAGGDVEIAAAVERRSEDERDRSGRNQRFQQSAQENLAGGVLRAEGDLMIEAREGDVRLSGVHLSSASGQTWITAERDAWIGAVTTEHHDYRESRDKKSGFLSSKKTHVIEEGWASVAEGSIIEGTGVMIEAGRDLTITGTAVVADGGVTLTAGRDLGILAAETTMGGQSHRQVTRSGLFASGLTLTVGKQQHTNDRWRDGTHAEASRIGSLEGDVTIHAGGDYRQEGSHLTAAGDLDVTARRIEITEARETEHERIEHRFKQSGLSIGVGGALIETGQTAHRLIDAGGRAESGRLRALAGGSLALNVHNNAKELSRAADALASGQPQNALNLSLSLGTAKSASQQTRDGDRAAGSSLRAGGAIRLTADGEGDVGGLLIRGSDVIGQGDVTLRSAGDLRLEAATNHASQSTRHRSSGASVGISLGRDSGVTVSAHGAEGRTEGEEHTWTHSHVQSGGTLTLDVGGDTRLHGAKAGGETVIARIGGDLHMESPQDTADYRSRQRSWGASVTLGPSPGASVSAGRARTESDYASARERSGLYAGDGGFQVEVAGDTHLMGAVIASGEQAVEEERNRFATGGELKLDDLSNRAEYQADGWGLTIGAGSQLRQSGAGAGEAEGLRTSQTRSGISGLAGDAGVRADAGDTGFAPIFDATRVEGDVQAQVTITREFLREGSKAWGDYANERLAEAVARVDEESAACWAPDGACRMAGHLLIGGLSGGAGGAVGAGLSSVTAPHVQGYLIENGVPEEAAQAITQMIVIGGGGAVGGVHGGTGAVNEASQNGLLAAPYLATMVLEGGVVAARTCYASPACMNTMRMAGLWAVAAVTEMAGLENGAGPSTNLPADTMGTPPGGADEPPPEESEAARRARINRERGCAFQECVKDARAAVEDGKNYSTILDNGTRVTVRPDLVGDKIIIEVKDVIINLSNSNQLRGLVQMAKDTGKPFELVISPRNNYISGPLWRMVTEDGVGAVRVFDPSTGRFTTVTSRPVGPR